MALLDAIQELDQKIAERDGTPLPEKEADPIVEAAPETEQTTEANDTQEEAAAPTEEAAPAKPTDADFARMRREKAAAEKRERELAAEVERLRNPKPVEQPKPAAAVGAEPDKAKDFEGWLEWKSRENDRKAQELEKNLEDVKAWKEQTEQEKQFERTKVQARKELETFEQEFAKTVPDYKEKRDFVIQTIARSLQVVNPSLQGEALTNALEMQVFKLAAQAQAQGFNPIEDLYHKAEAWGFQPKAPEPAETPATPAAKPSIAKIAENKRKSASSLSAGGKGAPAPLSKDAIAKMKFSDVASLSPEQFQQWEAASKAFEG